MEEKVPRFKTLSASDIVQNNDISLRLGQKDGDGFLDVVWDLLLTHLGAHDLHASTLLTSMFQDEASHPSNPGSRENPRKRPKIGIRVKIQLKTE